MPFGQTLPGIVRMNTRTVSIWSAAALCLALGQAVAADMPDSPPTPADKLATARTHIAAHRWPAALDELRRVNDKGSADWNNLMGYSLRKNSTPDLAGAERFYNEALRIAPNHLGALEYSGELALMSGDLGKACASKCEEYADLRKAVDAFKAQGGKTAAK
jgi:Flp pilus assembly protein TadD